MSNHSTDNCWSPVENKGCPWRRALPLIRSVFSLVSSSSIRVRATPISTWGGGNHVLGVGVQLHGKWKRQSPKTGGGAKVFFLKGGGVMCLDFRWGGGGVGSPQPPEDWEWRCHTPWTYRNPDSIQLCTYHNPNPCRPWLCFVHFQECLSRSEWQSRNNGLQKETTRHNSLDNQSIEKKCLFVEVWHRHIVPSYREQLSEFSGYECRRWSWKRILHSSSLLTGKHTSCKSHYSELTELSDQSPSYTAEQEELLRQNRSNLCSPEQMLSMTMQMHPLPQNSTWRPLRTRLHVHTPPLPLTGSGDCTIRMLSMLSTNTSSLSLYTVMIAQHNKFVNKQMP